MQENMWVNGILYCKSKVYPALLFSFKTETSVWRNHILITGFVHDLKYEFFLESYGAEEIICPQKVSCKTRFTCFFGPGVVR